MTVTIRRPSVSKEPFKNSRRSFSHEVIQIGALVLAFGLCLVLILRSDNNTISTWEDENSPVLLAASSPGRNSTENEGPIVRTSYGRIRGRIEKSRGGRNYTAFYQIPYAEPPVEEYRFQAPRPLKTKWRGVRDGTVSGDSDTTCIQFKGDKVNGKEDCLYLSVFTPKLPKMGRRRPNLPVLVYILGGANIFGRSNRYGADYVMDEDVVLVFMDFRVGNIGFLNTEDGEIRGNQAYKDQVEALKWVQKEIRKFGGDKRRVLIFGNSSGGGSVHALMLSPMAEGLFTRAVSQSGTVVNAPGRLTRPLESARSLGRQLNCSDVENTRALHQCLIKVDARDIVLTKLDDMLFLTKDGNSENGADADDSSTIFMPDHPFNLLKSGKFNKNVPWIVGANSAEAFIFSHTLLKMPDMVDQLNANWTTVAPSLFKFTDDDSHNASLALRQFYFGEKPIGPQTRQNLTNLVSDPDWFHPVTVAARYHAKYGGKAYFYWLTKEPVQSLGDIAKFDFEPPFGVHHADEVQYFFPYNPFPYIEVGSRDFNFSKKIIKTWADFARTGEPNVPDWSFLDETGQNSMWMDLNENFQPMDPLHERINFLDNFPFNYPEDRTV